MCHRWLSSLGRTSSVIATAACVLMSVRALPIASGEDVDLDHGPAFPSGEWTKDINVHTPLPTSNVRGTVQVRFRAPRMEFGEAHCWQQPTERNPAPWGHDLSVSGGRIKLSPKGDGAFTFSADDLPHGPINVRILAYGHGLRDLYELQLFNDGGVRWKMGAPANKPPAARDLQLIFSDDFDKPPSISGDGRNATYAAHKPRFGDFSGWPFTSPLPDGEPFSQLETWLRIRAVKDIRSPNGRTGLLSSVNMDGKGVWAKAPAYLEARFLAHSAPGTWPAFWTITQLDKGRPLDELDVIEAYGGVGKGNPGQPGYHINTHLWGQDAKKPGYHTYTHHWGKDKPPASTAPLITKLGRGASWSTTFHTYGVLIGLKETTYYLDDVEVLKHPTHRLSLTSPHCFLINYAIGGSSGWPIDLERYGNVSDMYIDYVRVYAKKPINFELPPPTPSDK